MVDRIRNLIERFPEDEEAVRELIKADRGLDALCREYLEAGDELRRLEQREPAARAADLDDLNKHRTALEEEILAKIEGYQPV